MKRTILILILLLCFPSICFAPDIWMDVDAAVVVPVNIYPITDTDLVIDSGVTYDEAGMALYWNFTPPAGPATVTAVTPTTGSMQDWSGGTGGMYFMEIAASGGDDIDNDTEGTGWFSGTTTATAPFRGPTIGFRAAALNDALIDGGDELDVNLTKINNIVTQLSMLMDASTTVNADANLDGVVVDKSVLSHLMTPAADTSTYKASTDSLEALLTVPFVDIAAGAPGYNVSWFTGLNYLYEAWRNKTVTNTTGDTTEVRLYKDNGTTILTEANAEDDGTSFTKDEYGAED